MKGIFLSLFLLPLLVFAQPPVPDSLMKGRPGIGKVFGSVTDSVTREALEFASVALIRVRDSMPVAGTLSDARGNYSMEELPPGMYILKISSIGYAPYSGRPVRLGPENRELDMGSIVLHPTIKRLKEAEVVGEKSEYVNSLDRKVYNLDKNIVNTGGTATEVLQNIPSVTVDIDGNISLRGSGNVTVLIDGRPSGITGSTRQAMLQQVPASSIDRIEVITNPSARYDADGMAGIINIITKKDKLKGLNGNVSAGAGTNEKYNLAAGANFRTGKFNLYGNYSFRHERRSSSAESTRYNTYADPPFYNLSNSHGTGVNDAHVLKGGLDIYLSNKTTLGLSGTWTHRDDNRPEFISYEDQNASRETISRFIRENDEKSNSVSSDYNLDLRKVFRKKGQELNAGITYSTNERENPEVYRTYSDVHILELVQNQTTETDNSVGTLQVDYIHPVTENSLLETGWKSIVRNIDSKSGGNNYFPSIDSYSDDPRFIDEFNYEEEIHAGYLMYSGKWKKFDFQAGVRAEEYINNGQSLIEGLDFDNRFFNLYPSGYLKYNFKGRQSVQAGYSRRVNRPESRSLNPFTDYSDSLNIRKGNPDIKPEYIDSYELSYDKDFEKHSFTLTGYYRFTHNMIARYRSLDPSTNVTTFTFLNFSSAQNTGVEVIVKNQVAEFLNVMTSANIFQNKTDAGNVEPDLQSESTGWNARTSINAKLSKTTSLQVTGMYTAAVTQPQGSFKGMSGVDAGIKQDLWKGKASLSLNVTDIFNTRHMEIHTVGTGYTSDNLRLRESRVGMLTFSYRFGNADVGQRKKSQRSQQQSQPESPGMDDF